MGAADARSRNCSTTSSRAAAQLCRAAAWHLMGAWFLRRECDVTGRGPRCTTGTRSVRWGGMTGGGRLRLVHFATPYTLHMISASKLSAVLLLCASAVLGAQRGTLMIVGGGPQPPALVQQFVDLAGGKGKAKIIVFAEASADGEKSGEEKANDLRKLGAQARNVWIVREQADADSIVHLLDGATGVWFGGGDQSRLI